MNIIKTKSPVMIRKVIISVFIGMLFTSSLTGQETREEKKQAKEEKIKKGWTFGALPSTSYDSDIGFKYGAVVNFYNFGDGSIYPKYKHSVFLEWSRTTKGCGINMFTYDSEYLIPGIRVTAEASLLTEKALDFYGFNGYNSYYSNAYEEKDDP